LNVDKVVSPGVDCANATVDGNRELKEVYNLSQQSSTRSRRSSALSSDSVRTEILNRIGEQQFEDVLFKPKQRKKRTKTKQKRKFVSGTESGSDTISTSSIHSMSDGEDPWSSDRLDISSDCSVSTRPSEGSNNVQLDRRSSSEETLVRLGDCISSCISSEVATLPGDSCSENDKVVNDSSTLVEATVSQKSSKDKRPGELCLGEEFSVPPEIQPDLRSPASIERDVASKERILAKVLMLDSLCEGDKSETLNGEHTCDINKIDAQEIIAEKVKVNDVTLRTCILSEELTHDIKFGDQETEDMENQSSSVDDDSVSQHSDNIQDSQDEKLASFSSVLSYGPPSGSSASPSNHTSLEIFSSSDPKTDFICDRKLYEAVERAGRWMQYKVPDTIVNLSVCKYYVCCVDSKDVAYYSALNDLSLKWQKVDYKAKQIAVSPNGTLVWKLHKCTAYGLECPSVKGPFGGRWIEVMRNVQWISVADTIAWFISDGCIYIHKQLSFEHPSSTARLVHCNQHMARICCFQNSVIALTCTGEVLFRSGVSYIVPEGRTWETVNVPCLAVTDIALGCHGTAWVVDQKNAIHFSCNFTAPDSQWWQVSFSWLLKCAFDHH
jgi:hypothetical protein